MAIIPQNFKVLLPLLYRFLIPQFQNLPTSRMDFFGLIILLKLFFCREVETLCKY